MEKWALVGHLTCVSTLWEEAWSSRWFALGLILATLRCFRMIQRRYFIWNQFCLLKQKKNLVEECGVLYRIEKNAEGYVCSLCLWSTFRQTESDLPHLGHVEEIGDSRATLLVKPRSKGGNACHLFLPPSWYIASFWFWVLVTPLSWANVLKSFEPQFPHLQWQYLIQSSVKSIHWATGC